MTIVSPGPSAPPYRTPPQTRRRRQTHAPTRTHFCQPHIAIHLSWSPGYRYHRPPFHRATPSTQQLGTLAESIGTSKTAPLLGRVQFGAKWGCPVSVCVYRGLLKFSMVGTMIAAYNMSRARTQTGRRHTWKFTPSRDFQDSVVVVGAFKSVEGKKLEVGIKRECNRLTRHSR